MDAQNQILPKYQKAKQINCEELFIKQWLTTSIKIHKSEALKR